MLTSKQSYNTEKRKRVVNKTRLDQVAKNLSNGIREDTSITLQKWLYCI